jgi:SulP family sulfate permease
MKRILKLNRLLEHLSADTLRRDLSAGLTIAFVALPQSMAYALVAGVKPEYGLYAFIVGSIIGALFGSSRHLQTGPTNATSIVVGSTLAAFTSQENFMGLVFLLGFLAGFFQLAAGLFRLGNLTQFISRSVVAGFIAGAGCLIITDQLPNLLGIPRYPSSSVVEGFFQVLSHLNLIHPPTLSLGVGTILLVLLINKISPKTSSGQTILPAYALAIFAAAAVVAVWDLDSKGVKIVGEIRGSLPPLSMPDWNWNMIQNLTPGAIAIALIGLAESTSASKTVASFSGDRLNADREFMGQGLAKIAAAFFSGIPVSGSLNRTVLCYRVGAVTKFANIFAGIFTAAIVLFFSPVARYIPLASLAGIMMITAGTMADRDYIKLAWRSTRSDAAAMIITFAAALVFPLDTAIYLGVAVSIALFLRRVRTPHLIELNYDPRSGFQEIPGPVPSGIPSNGDSAVVSPTPPRTIPELSIIHVEGDIFFGGVEYLEDEILKIARQEEIKAIILRMKRALSLDATSLLALIKINDEIKRQGKLLLISGAAGQVGRVFHQSGFEEVIGEENIFYSEKTLFKSTRDAMNYAVAYINEECGKDYKLNP